MNLTRVVTGAATAAVTHRFTSGDDTESILSPAGVTATVTRADGTTVTGTAVTGPVANMFTLTLPGDALADPDVFTIRWSGTVNAATTTAVVRVEVVGGRLFSLTEARQSDPSLADVNKYPQVEIAARRLEVELEAERICGRSFFPRFRHAALNGSGGVGVCLPDVDIRRLRSVAVGGTALDPADVAANTISTNGAIFRPAHAAWPRGVGNLTIGYEFGLDGPPEDVRQAALIRLRSLLNRARSGVPDRVSAYTTEAGTFRVSMPGARRTGIPDVDAAYDRWSVPRWGFA